jgi:hypothetical protein
MEEQWGIVWYDSDPIGKRLRYDLVEELNLYFKYVDERKRSSWSNETYSLDFVFTTDELGQNSWMVGMKVEDLEDITGQVLKNDLTQATVQLNWHKKRIKLLTEAIKEMN